MAVSNLMTRAYANNIYYYGNRTFSTIPADYHEPVKQYAAANYDLYTIDRAFNQGYITETEYNETLAYRA